MLVHWQPLSIHHNFLKKIITILTIYTPSQVTTLCVTWWQNNTASGSITERDSKKLMFYCSTCSIQTRVYYCHGPVRMGSQLRNFFILNHHFISLCSVDWCIRFQSLHQFTCWSYFCASFLPDFLIPNCYNPYVWYAWNFHLVMFIFLFECMLWQPCQKSLM